MGTLCFLRSLSSFIKVMIKIVLSIAFVAIACGKTVPGGYSQNPLLPPDLFIIGGDPAEPHAYPWQISLQVKRSGAWSHNCGGSIVDESTIVCAAHCVYQKTADSMQVVAGAQFLSKDDDHSKQVRTISELIAHAKYNPNTLGVNDISLIKLSEPLAFDEFVGPIKMPEQGEMLQMIQCVRILDGAIPLKVESTILMNCK